MYVNLIQCCNIAKHDRRTAYTAYTRYAGCMRKNDAAPLWPKLLAGLMLCCGTLCGRWGLCYAVGCAVAVGWSGSLSGSVAVGHSTTPHLLSLTHSASLLLLTLSLPKLCECSLFCP